ncbi:self-protective colicin-like immunity protein [Pasteurella langaaensis DSM 22999]|uniref:Self-protective colicin-like immunity protein n=1 Tax=Alitibacter langaaensis DSM 22999 TaxID=1122935 RepID=A0A2U0SNS1_9PAST|nr:colicin immunity domain-containing protein [Pasteurella langaaensis]PVX32994.1 self-protective colicin-like immunity protein [Pasteurella langaaensis DSM 22999]
MAKSLMLQYALDFHKGHVPVTQFADLFFDLFYDNKQSSNEEEAAAEATIFLCVDAYSPDVPKDQMEIAELCRMSEMKLRKEVEDALKRANVL